LTLNQLNSQDFSFLILTDTNTNTNIFDKARIGFKSAWHQTGRSRLRPGPAIRSPIGASY
jgi:hypothetical protein